MHNIHQIAAILEAHAHVIDQLNARITLLEKERDKATIANLSEPESANLPIICGYCDSGKPIKYISTGRCEDCHVPKPRPGARGSKNKRKGRK